ncbi:MAG TPA: SDR family NAD(P)-dependent oxidoreductase [Methylomirabilota bacterium]|nr:SDR family NAD(P)-dependent oxidoreductase [Methylomirabilota bacterium]
MSFTNKTAIVTGAGGGMGLNIARDLLAGGARVTMIDLKPERPADLPADRALYLIGDVTDDTFVYKAIAHAFHETGHLDYLVNAAGVLLFGRDKSLVEIDLDLWDKVLAVDLKSMVITTRAAVPFMQQSGGGAMVHISSIQCLRGDDKPQDAYQAAKAGMLALSKSIAIQFARDGIRSNCILPGPVDSPMQDRWRGHPAQKQAVANAVPLGRVGTTQDVADACLFLLSDKASYITGTELIVDGGLMARP